MQRLRRATEEQRATGQHHAHPGAYHDFDNPAGKLRVRSEVPNGVNKDKGVTVGPDPKAREDAMAKIDALLPARLINAGRAAFDRASRRR